MTIQEKAKAAIPLLQAVAEGKTMQYKINDVWWDQRPTLDLIVWYPEDWRIKPEPREWWIDEYAAPHGLMHYLYSSSEEAGDRRVQGASFIRTIHVREIL